MGLDREGTLDGLLGTVVFVAVGFEDMIDCFVIGFWEDLCYVLRCRVVTHCPREED